LYILGRATLRAVRVDGDLADLAAPFRTFRHDGAKHSIAGAAAKSARRAGGVSR
jgi:hypothetical protein